MSEAQDADSKQFDPTPKKLEDARKKGEIAKSVDLTTACAYAGLFLTLWVFGSSSLLAFAETLTEILANPDLLSGRATNQVQVPILGDIFFTAIVDLSPLLVFPGIAALLCLVAQRAIIFAPTKINPKLERVSMLSGLKNKFGRQGIFEFFKSATKLIIYCVVLGFFLSSEIEGIIAAVKQNPAVVTAMLGQLTLKLTLWVTIVAVVLGGIDFVWQSAEHTRKNRMSRQEIMDEMKQSEGDPTTKQQRRQKGMSLAMNRMLSDVPKADVVIVNPTHFAVALSWDMSQGSAPVCVAKGVDEIAARIRELAMENAVPIHSDPPSARALYAEVKVGEQIHQSHFLAVAAAIRFAEAIRMKARK